MTYFGRIFEGADEARFETPCHRHAQLLLDATLDIEDPVRRPQRPCTKGRTTRSVSEASLHPRRLLANARYQAEKRG